MANAQHERVEGRVRDLVASGEAVVETPRGVVFARFAAPGERVLMSLDARGGRVKRGRVLRVLESAPERVEPSCAYVERCGGCPFMHLSLEAQHAHKRRFLREALVRAGAPEALEVPMIAAGEVLAYRRRARLSFRVAGKARALGYRREHSKDVVDVGRCVVLDSALSTAFEALRGELLPHLAGEGEILLARGSAGGPVAAVRAVEAQPPEVYAALGGLVRSARLEGAALWAFGASKPASFGDAAEWSLGADGAPLEGSVGGFSQAHAEVNRRLIARVSELARTAQARVLELYAGHGNFTVALCREAQSYTAVEQDPAAVAALRRNLAARGLRAKVVEGAAEKQLAGGPLDVVVLDPPRVGAKGVLEALLARKPKRVVYVSCDPATLGRDVAPLLSRGYRLAAAEAFDMFPQTADLESLVLLERV